ncbi:MAG: DUF2442 domain-containing protein [Elusimicrobia bacterium]|nr:DUF2442 domain-containing protein [Elusimicrobiota bacterium]
MSILALEARAAQVWFDDNSLCVLLQDGRKISVPLSYFPRLLKATPEQRQKHELSGGGLGIHWDELDEDISVPALLAGVPDQTQTG